jgi:DNA primase
MAIFSKETLSRLRDQVDLVQLISSHLAIKKAGAIYKGLCPFHDEKTPSFVVNPTDKNYHCFGCGAHGDALQFLMGYLRYSFSEAVEFLGDRFGIPLEKEEGDSQKSFARQEIKRAQDRAQHLFRFHLLHTREGEEALAYLASRGIALPFIERFQLGFAPKQGLLKKWLEEEKITDEIQQASGLLSTNGRELFSERITFPIFSLQGALIGFSARKIREETFGGKYINTSETLLFKKSKVLFGGHQSRKRMAKEQKAIVVEGQIDCLRLIDEGFDFSVASQGTAFGLDHVKELNSLGVKRVFLAFDGDKAGQEAIRKTGHLFTQNGVEVKVVVLPEGDDPDSLIRKEGKERFQKELDQSIDFLDFLIRHEAKSLPINTPHGKNEWVKRLVQAVSSWNQPLIEHECLKKISDETKTPLELLGRTSVPPPTQLIRRSGILNPFEVDYDLILEKDFLFWFIQGREAKLKKEVMGYVKADDFVTPLCRSAYIFVEGRIEKPLLEVLLECEEGALQEFFSEITEKKVVSKKGESLARESFQKFLDRNWLKKREEVKKKMNENVLTDDEALVLAQEFSAMKRVEIGKTS